MVNIVSANSADPDEMLHYAVFYLGLHFLPKHLFRGLPSLQAKGTKSSSFLMRKERSGLSTLGLRRWGLAVYRGSSTIL